MLCFSLHTAAFQSVILFYLVIAILFNEREFVASVVTFFDCFRSVPVSEAGLEPQRAKAEPGLPSC
jgi:hypothetical protein